MKRPSSTDGKSIRYKFRKRRFKTIELLLDDIIVQRGKATVLDVGGRRRYWKLLDPRFAGKVSITILNNEAENADGQHEEIGLEMVDVVGDGCNMPQYEDGSFDLTHSNSVIEHVGPLGNMAKFADETRRIGRAYYLQTPNFWFPLEPHYGVPFFHWLPETARAGMHSRHRVGFAPKLEYRDALEIAGHVKLVNRTLPRNLFPDGVQISERFALLVKSLMVYRKARPIRQGLHRASRVAIPCEAGFLS